MLNNVEWLGNRVLERPSCAWWNDALWVAHLDLNEQVTVTRVVVQDSPAIASSTSLGINSSLSPAITPFGPRLIVASAAPAKPILLSTSIDGATFDPPIALPFVSPMSPALAEAGDLWLAWVDEEFLLHLARSNDGVSFVDHPTSISASGPAAIAGISDPVDAPALAVAWIERDSNVIMVTSFRESDFDPGLPALMQLPDVEIDHVAVTFAPGHVAAQRRILVGLERFKPPRASTRDHRVFARQVSRDLATMGGLEPMPHPGVGPGFAHGPGRVWAVWRDMAEQADHLVVAPYDIAFGLPAELEALLGTSCKPHLCTPDLRLVCAGTEDFEWQWEPAWIRNAFKGDLVVTPADGAGIIGRFLKKLAYEQRYDHMGIMIDDHYTVRHATMAHDRIKAYFTGSMFGFPVPIDGIRPDIVKYGWPGTITQTVQNAFFDGYNDGANSQWIDTTAPPPPPDPGEDATDEQKESFQKAVKRFRGFVDPELQNGERIGYAFANLTWSPQLRTDGSVVEPLVVRPPRAAESADSLVRPTLHRVAEASKTIRGHYRFYAYTQGTIVSGPIMAGPPIGHPTWHDLPAGADWSAGSAAVVCSTFIWAAVQEASRMRRPALGLEGVAETTAQESWRSQIHVIHDGLYRYHEEERRSAAQELHDYTAERVRSEVWAKMIKLKSEIGWLVAILRWSLATLLALFAMPLPALASLLGIRLEQAKELLLLLNGMPSKVANQICNTFASDQSDQIEDPYWEAPGEGVSAAPHDTVYLWDAPDEANERYRRGLWGDRERLCLPEPRWERRRKHVYAHARGLAEVIGRVTYKGTDAPLVGVNVRIGCEKTMTGMDGFYRLEVASGPREIIAGIYWPNSRWWLEGRRFADIMPGANPGHDIVLEDPPEWRRVLQIQIKLDLVHQVLVGHDDWKHETHLQEHRFVKYPLDWGEPHGGAPKYTWDELWDKAPITSDYAGDERARLRIRATFAPGDLSIKVELRGELIEDEEADIEVSADNTITVPIDETRKVLMSLKSGEEPPDRASLEIVILNLREMA